MGTVNLKNIDVPAEVILAMRQASDSGSFRKGVWNDIINDAPGVWSINNVYRYFKKQGLADVVKWLSDDNDPAKPSGIRFNATMLELANIRVMERIMMRGVDEDA